MLTWMTRASFLDTARDLDLDLLALTAKQSARLLDAVTGGEPLDEFSPVAAMWSGHEVALAAYNIALVVEAGARNVTLFDSRDSLKIAEEIGGEFVRPPWIDDHDVLRSHRSNLARRWPKKYGKAWGKSAHFAWPYVWPVITDDGYELRLSKHDKALIAEGSRALPEEVRERITNL